VFSAVQELLRRAADEKAPAKDVEEWVDTALRAAEKYGPRFLQETAVRCTMVLFEQEEYAKVALAADRRAAKAINPSDPALDRFWTLDLRGLTLKKGKQPVPPELDARIAKLEGAGMEEHVKRVQAFKVDKFAGRKGKSTRTVLVELFTGAQCPPCVA